MPGRVALREGPQVVLAHDPPCHGAAIAWPGVGHHQPGRGLSSTTNATPSTETLARFVRSNLCSRRREQSVLARDMAVSPLLLSSPDEGTCLLGLCNKQYRAAGHTNPGKRLEISCHKPGIFLKSPQWYTCLLTTRRRLWRSRHAAGTREDMSAYPSCHRHICKCSVG